MLKHVLDWFKQEPEQVDDQPKTCPSQRAAAALMIEVAMSDQEFDEVEKKALPNLLREHTGLTTQECLQLIEIGEKEVDHATSLHQFTRHLNENFTIDEKKDLLNTLWMVAFSDGNIDKYEEHIIRRIADLLHLRHSEFIQAKLKAQDAQ